MGPQARRHEAPQDRHGGQPRRPHHRPLRRPPRRLRRPRRRHGALVDALRGQPAVRGAAAGRLRPSGRRGRHLAGDPRPQGRHRTHPARLPRRPGRRGLAPASASARRWTGSRSKYEGPWADELRITLRQMDMGVSRRQAFDELRKRNASEQVAQFVTALQQGEELGAPDRRHPDPDRRRTCAAPTPRTPAGKRRRPSPRRR